MDKHFTIDKLNKNTFINHLNQYGYVIVENVISDDLVKNLRLQLEKNIEEESNFHQSTDYNDYGTLLCCPIYGGHYFDLIQNKDLMRPFEWILDESCIVYAFTSSSIPPYKTNRTSKIHVDRNYFNPNHYDALGCLILLDDFNEENGSTWVLPKSHLVESPPSEEYFYSNAVRIKAPKGSTFYFNLRLWHASGKNHTNDWRHSLGIGMVRNYLKQRFDIPRTIKNVNLDGLTEYGFQKLGFYSQPPTSLEEYYMPLSKRPYK